MKTTQSAALKTASAVKNRYGASFASARKSAGKSPVHTPLRGDDFKPILQQLLDDQSQKKKGPAGVFMVSDDTLDKEALKLELSQLDPAEIPKPRPVDAEILKKIESTILEMNKEEEEDTEKSPPLPVLQSELEVKRSEVDDHGDDKDDKSDVSENKKESPVDNVSERTETSHGESESAVVKSSTSTSDGAGDGAIKSGGAESGPSGSDGAGTSGNVSGVRGSTESTTEPENESSSLSGDSERLPLLDSCQTATPPEATENSNSCDAPPPLFPMQSTTKSQSSFFDNLQKTIQSCKEKLGISDDEVRSRLTKLVT